jgi:hypothetical protein
MADAKRFESPLGEVAPLKTGPWSDEEISLLTRLWAENVSNLDISRRIGRRENAIAIKASRLSLPPKAQIAARAAMEKHPRNPKARVRPCLTCSRQFFSEGVGHRICDACKSSRSWGDDYVVRIGGSY